MKYIKDTTLVITFLLCTFLLQAQYNKLRFPENEHVIAKLHTHYHFTETNANYQGLNYALEAGYTGIAYVVLGFERFSALKGGVVHGTKLDGYTSFNGSIGVNLTHGYREQWNYNAGIRLVRVYRGPISENYKRELIGWEAATTYQVTQKLGVGFRATIDYRYDQEIFGWTPQHTFSGFFSITYKLFQINYKSKY